MNDTRLYYLVELAVSGLLDDAEQAELNAWLSTSPENKGIYEEIVGILELSGGMMAAVDPQTDAEWARLSAAMAAPAKPVTTAKPVAPAAKVIRPPFWSAPRVWSAAAAVVLLGVVGSYFAFFQAPTQPQEAQHYATALGETKEIQLADGSHVRLNGGSTLDAAPGYGLTDRKLTLHGEAYFEVAKDQDRPFIVMAGGAQSQALGTKFNVRVSNVGEQVQLSVTEGRVRFSADQRGSLELTAGQVAHFDHASGFSRETQQADDVAAWVDNRLIFRDTPFPQATEQLERGYGVTIQFPERLNAALLNANFDRKPLSQVLEVLQAMYGLKVTQAGKVVTLSE